MNAHDAVVNGMLAAIAADPALASGNVFKNRIRKISEGTTAAVAVTFGSATPAQGEIRGAPTDWTTRIVVECYARNETLAIDQETLSLQLHADVYVRLMADPTLGGVAMDVLDPQIDMDFDSLETDMACVVAQYTVLHRTDAHTLETPAP